MRTVELNAPGHGSMALTLRPLTGADELSLSGTGLGPAMALLARLSGSDPAGLSVSQIDRGLAGIYAMLYGETAECRASCARCGEAYEFALNLPGIIAAQDAERPGPPDDEGVWDMPGGARVRAPTPADLSGDPAALAAALERLIRDPKARLNLGAAGARRVRQRFAMDAGVDALLERFGAPPSLAAAQ